MPIEITLGVGISDPSREYVHIQLLNISGLSLEEAERLADNLDGAIRLSKYDSAAVSRVAWYLLRDFPETSWGITVRYSDGRNDGLLSYRAPGEVPVSAFKEPPPDVQRVSRYERKPII